MVTEYVMKIEEDASLGGFMMASKCFCWWVHENDFEVFKTCPDEVFIGQFGECFGREPDELVDNVSLSCFGGPYCVASIVF